MAADRSSARPRRGRAAMLVGAVLVLLLASGLVWWLASRPGDPRDVVDTWVEAVNSGDTDTVRALMCRQRRDALPRDYVASRLAEDGNEPSLTEVRIGEPREEDEGVTVDVRFVFRGGPRETTLRLVDEDGWRLCDGAWVNF